MQLVYKENFIKKKKKEVGGVSNFLFDIGIFNPQYRI